MSRPNCHSEVFRRILLQSPGEIAAYRGGSNKTLQGDCSDFAVLLVRKAGLFMRRAVRLGMGEMGVR
jgi:hypothetical protein